MTGLRYRFTQFLERGFVAPKGIILLNSTKPQLIVLTEISAEGGTEGAQSCRHWNGGLLGNLQT
jgi:hypothetical protein